MYRLIVVSPQFETKLVVVNAANPAVKLSFRCSNLTADFPLLYHIDLVFYLLM